MRLPLPVFVEMDSTRVFFHNRFSGSNKIFKVGEAITNIRILFENIKDTQQAFLAVYQQQKPNNNCDAKIWKYASDSAKFPSRFSGTNATLTYPEGSRRSPDDGAEEGCSFSVPPEGVRSALDRERSPFDSRDV